MISISINVSSIINIEIILIEPFVSSTVVHMIEYMLDTSTKVRYIYFSSLVLLLLEARIT